MKLFSQLQERCAKWWVVPEEEGDMEYMTSVSEALLKKTPHVPQAFLKIFFLLVFVFFLWACLATVNEFTRGFGKVIPSQELQVIQNLEGGILSELYVREGELVEKNQPLMRLDDTRFSSSFRENGLKLNYLKVKAARLQAESKGEDFILPESEGSSFFASEKRLFDSRANELKTELSTMQEKVLQKIQEKKELEQRLDKLGKSYSLLDKEYKLTKPLIKSGAVSEVEVIRLQRSLADLDGDISEVKLALPRLDSELKEVKNNLKQAKEIFTIEAQAELNDAQAEISQLQESVGALGDRVQRTTIRSPVRGRVKQIKITTVGGVVQPGMDLIEIVPFEDKLFVEVKINPKDVAFIHPEQSASVKVTAYDFSIHGDLKGKVVNISPDTITDDKGNNFYIIKIETEESFFEKNGKKLPIIPGMIVEANIVTGQKTIMSYLLKPILKTKQLALRER